LYHIKKNQTKIQEFLYSIIFPWHNEGVINLELHEAQLFRILASLFGKERVVYNMSLNTVCEEDKGELGRRETWWIQYKCLFAVTDIHYNPRLVIDFAPGFNGVIDAEQAYRRDSAKSALNTHGVHYIGITREEFNRILDPESHFGLLQLLELKVEKGDISLDNIF
jgi:hypothetical protein